ncbi:stage III sporulation protein AG [Effusibacillus dendaii]|uniref:Stage III sporulation protein AG n=1 Tax=Effusibacillus dendaii TaxID=2743772 RepID=A0A7I8D757_9BACL|nr:stage III sporulation protein AG [Effusibacillus dendaii]BCJ85924.1 stage III sporulation protein AG [Effusibacillus dendaii]
MKMDTGIFSRVPKWMYLLAIAGVVLIVSGSFLTPTNSQPKLPEPPAQAKTEINTDSLSMAEYERLYEKRLAEILNQIQGVTDATVMVNLDSTEEVVLASNKQNQRTNTTELDKQGGNRTITTFNENEQLVMTNGSNDHPVVLRTIKPHVRGVLVVAKGAEQPRVQMMIMESIERVLEVPPHRISIQPKKM